MPTTPAKTPEAEDTLSRESWKAPGLIGWSSFFFALLQSICTFFAALNGLRLVIGVGSLVVSATTVATLSQLHANWIRIPMVVLALAGSLLNLVVLMQIRRLRNRPAAQWRQRPLSSRKIWMERTQWGLSIATLVLVGIEEYIHVLWHHYL